MQGTNNGGACVHACVRTCVCRGGGGGGAEEEGAGEAERGAGDRLFPCVGPLVVVVGEAGWVWWWWGDEVQEKKKTPKQSARMGRAAADE